MFQIFGPNAQDQVGFVIAERAEEGTIVSDSVDTVNPLAQSLSLPVDTSW